MKKELVWEYFVDPLGYNLSDIGERSAQDILSDIENDSDNDEDDDEDEDEDEDDEDDSDLKEKEKGKVPEKGFRTKILNTTFGLCTLTPSNQPSKNFNMWIGYTNFDLTEHVLNKIEKVAGVEALDIFSRYRFKITIGILFDTRNVLQDVRKVALEEEPIGLNLMEITPSDKEKVNSIISKISHRHWIVYLLPNGHIQTIFSDEDNPNFQEAKKLITETHSKVGGFIFAS